MDSHGTNIVARMYERLIRLHILLGRLDRSGVSRELSSNSAFAVDLIRNRLRGLIRELYSGRMMRGDAESLARALMHVTIGRADEINARRQDLISRGIIRPTDELRLGRSHEEDGLIGLLLPITVLPEFAAFASASGIDDASSSPM